MARPAAWWLRRLRAMPLAEVQHRARRLARYPLDRALIATGLYARPMRELRDWKGPSVFYFDRDISPPPLSERLRAHADAVCAGKREVLGLGWIDVPDEPWHFEPNAKALWPFVPSSRVRTAAAAHFDPRLTWELNRGHEWVVLARAWHATRDTRYRAQLDDELARWRRVNPLGMGINWVSAMEAAIRIHSLAWVAAFLRGEPMPSLAAMIHEHVVFVRRNLSLYSSANNHLIVELSALVIAARVLGGSDEASLARLDREIERQVFADGVNAEMATHYHAFVLEAVLLVAQLERRHGEPCARLERAISAMVDYLAHVRCADGALLQQGDSDDGAILGLFRDAHTDQLLEAASALAQPTSEPSRHEGVFWLTNGHGGSPASVPCTSRLWPQSGQVHLRSPRLLATFDAGPFGFGSLAAHAHCDTLAINVAVDGRRVFVDRGTYRYNGDDEARTRFRMTAAHNTLQLGNREQATSGGPFLWTTRPSVRIERCVLDREIDVVAASHDGFQVARHTRVLIRKHDVLLVLDRVDGDAARERATVRYHLAPELSLRREADAYGSLTVLHASSMSDIAWLVVRGASRLRVVDSVHSDRYGETTPAQTIECADVATLLITVIGPHGVTDRAEVIRGMIDAAAERGLLAQEAISELRTGGTSDPF